MLSMLLQPIIILKIAKTYLNEDPPYLVFIKLCVLLLMIAYLLEQISVVAIFHYDTKLLSFYFWKMGLP
jgi:hypothetical protein